MSYVCCVIAVVSAEKNNGASEASINTPSESFDESIDKATLTSLLVDAFSELAVIVNIMSCMIST